MGAHDAGPVVLSEVDAKLSKLADLVQVARCELDTAAEAKDWHRFKALAPCFRALTQEYASALGVSLVAEADALVARLLGGGT